MEKRLIIIDGNSIINRAFYALPDMSNSEGLKTNAIFGFVRMMFKIIEDYQPTHMSVAFDKKAPTFRHKQYADYKAGRKKMPDEFKDKISDDDKQAIEKAVEEAEKHKDSEDKDELDAAIKALNDAIMPIGSKMYQQSADDKKADESGDKKSDKDEPVEGEVVDEK